MKRKLHGVKQSGFTLIELLVVIAIIGLLAAVVLASLGTARSKGIDASVRQQVNAGRSQAELFAATHLNSYAGACAAAASSQGLIDITTSAAVKSGKGVATPNNAISTAGSWNTVTCHDTAGAWAIEAPLSASISGTPSMWCVDSIGTSKVNTTNIAANAITC